MMPFNPHSLYTVDSEDTGMFISFQSQKVLCGLEVRDTFKKLFVFTNQILPNRFLLVLPFLGFKKFLSPLPPILFK